MSASHIRVIDFETDGLDDGARVVEAAFCDVVNDEGRWLRSGPLWSSLVNPGRPIDVRAMAVHHITDDQVKDSPAFDAVKPLLGLVDEERPVTVFAAHFAEFERRFYAPADAAWICTWKCAVTAWPDAPGHKNQELRYWLGLKLRPELCARAHRAPDDAYVTAAILVRLLADGWTVEQMVDITAKPVVLPFFSFGMHAMKRIGEKVDDGNGGWSWAVPTSYLEWIIKQQGMDANVRHTAFANLTARRQE